MHVRVDHIGDLESVTMGLRLVVREIPLGVDDRGHALARTPDEIGGAGTVLV
jgi:hypothetical protein